MAHSEADGERAVTRGCREGASRVRKPKQTYSRAMTSDTCVRRRREAARSGSFGSRPASSRRSGYRLGSPFGFASTKVIVNGGRPSATHMACARSRSMRSAAALAADSFVASSVI
jgi:hypothetical protein